MLCEIIQHKKSQQQQKNLYLDNKQRTYYSSKFKQQAHTHTHTRYSSNVDICQDKKKMKYYIKTFFPFVLVVKLNCADFHQFHNRFKKKIKTIQKPLNNNTSFLFDLFK